MNKIVDGKIIPLTEEEITQRNADAIKAQEEQAIQIIKDGIDANLEYLSSTDWYVVRFSETGIVIPAEVATARAEARANINTLEGQI